MINKIIDKNIFLEKYLKYKFKYLNIKNKIIKIGGTNSGPELNKTCIQSTLDLCKKSYSKTLDSFGLERILNGRLSRIPVFFNQVENVSSITKLSGNFIGHNNCIGEKCGRQIDRFLQLFIEHNICEHNDYIHSSYNERIKEINKLFDNNNDLNLLKIFQIKYKFLECIECFEYGINKINNSYYLSIYQLIITKINNRLACYNASTIYHKRYMYLILFIENNIHSINIDTCITEHFYEDIKNKNVQLIELLKSNEQELKYIAFIVEKLIPLLKNIFDIDNICVNLGTLRLGEFFIDGHNICDQGCFKQIDRFIRKEILNECNRTDDVKTHRENNAKIYLSNITELKDENITKSVLYFNMGLLFNSYIIDKLPNFINYGTPDKDEVTFRDYFKNYLITKIIILTIREKIVSDKISETILKKIKKFFISINLLKNIKFIETDVDVNDDDKDKTDVDVDKDKTDVDVDKNESDVDDDDIFIQYDFLNLIFKIYGMKILPSIIKDYSYNELPNIITDTDTTKSITNDTIKQNINEHIIEYLKKSVYQSSLTNFEYLLKVNKDIIITIKYLFNILANATRDTLITTNPIFPINFSFIPIMCLFIFFVICSFYSTPFPEYL